MTDKKINFPIIGLGYGKVDSKGELLNVHYEKIVSKISAEYDSIASQNISKDVDKNGYLNVKVMLDQDSQIRSIGEAYLKLYLISLKMFLPNTLNLDGLFKFLRTIAWTSDGPYSPDEIDHLRNQKKIDVRIHSLDKFPRLTDYIIPKNVRIADSARVRLGAYLSAGTTVMHEGFVNFNAGTLGPAMIEGRISSGVIVGANSDLGGGSSTMGTLSGGNDIKISIGQNCLLGANSGLGIPLGNNCIVEAGLYLTAGTKLKFIKDDEIHEMKAADLSGMSDILFRRNSITGIVEALANSKDTNLNPELHKN